MRSATELSGISLLVVDDEADLRLGVRRLLEPLGARVREAADAAAALTLLRAEAVDVVLTDLSMPGLSGIDLIPQVKANWPRSAIVVLTGYGTIQAAVTCLQRGASHFLTKPCDNREIVETLGRLGRQVMAARRASGAAPELIAVDARMRAVLELVARVAPSPVPVLIQGESGTGKELVARAIHDASTVAGKGFHAVNAAALPDTLLEAELFGCRRGAFTGADRDRDGLFVTAAGGTVFLDEIASMSLAFQAKLLRVLQERVVRPLGALKDVTVDFRLVTATNRDLEDLIRAGTFREDLYYRLHVVTIQVPPLRARPDDLLPLARHFLARAARESLVDAGRAPELSEDAVAAIQSHRWPGNVRELENALRRAVVVGTGQWILPHHLGLGLSSPLPSPCVADADYESAKRAVIEKFQREFVQRALERTGGNVSEAAGRCGLTRAALQRIMRALGIGRAEFRRGEHDAGTA